MIVIPMAGMSSRFFNAGYTKPKYMLKAHGKTLFEHAVESFEAYFASKTFLFIVKDVFDTAEFVERKASALGITEFYIVTLEHDTRGQAETVTLGLEKIKAQLGEPQGSMTVFNIDTFRPGFILPEVSVTADGYLEVFEGEGANWSFAKPAFNYSTKVIETAEKQPISNLCSTGLYHFKSINQYLDAYASYIVKPQSEWEKGELYIAPLYNELIKNGLEIHYHLIDSEDVIFCGIPEEYDHFLKRK